MFVFVVVYFQYAITLQSLMCFKFKDLEKSELVPDDGVITVRIEKLKVIPKVAMIGSLPKNNPVTNYFHLLVVLFSSGKDQSSSMKIHYCTSIVHHLTFHILNSAHFNGTTLIKLKSTIETSVSD